MRRAVLIYNPVAGRSPLHRRAVIDEIIDALRNCGWDAEAIATESPGSAGEQARRAADAGAEIVFAAGGDGTVHEVLQGLAHNSKAALGVVPLGSANALARHLGLPLEPVEAAILQLGWIPRSIPAGRVTCSGRAGQVSRYFLVMAGAGPDGELVYRMLAGGKHRYGRLAYYARAAWLFASRRFIPFILKMQSAGKAPERHTAVSAMSVRVGDLGGIFGPLLRGAKLDDAQLLVSFVRPPAKIALAGWFALNWLKLGRLNRFAATHRVESFACSAPGTAQANVQADGEWLGRTPMHVELVPSAVRLLLPG